MLHINTSRETVLSPNEINSLTPLGLSASLFGKQDWVMTEFQTEVLALIHNITKNRNRRASGPVHYQHPSVTFMLAKLTELIEN